MVDARNPLRFKRVSLWSFLVSTLLAVVAGVCGILYVASAANPHGSGAKGLYAASLWLITGSLTAATVSNLSGLMAMVRDGQACPWIVGYALAFIVVAFVYVIVVCGLWYL